MLSDTFDSKRYPRTSKLEQTILTNRGMNIHLNRSLRVIEVDRRRMLKLLARKQRQVRADLKVKKDEKFHLMLRHQMRKMSNEAPEPTPKTRRNILNSTKSTDDIESALFTNGLVNAPGVNHRMKRLGARRRILPEYEVEETDSEKQEDAGVAVQTPPSEFSDNLTGTISREPTLRTLAPGGDIRWAHNPERIESSGPRAVFRRSATANPLPAGGGKRSEAMVWMTSGICSVINRDAELKTINYESEMVQKLSQTNLEKTTTLNRASTITNFSLLSKPLPRIGNHQSHGTRLPTRPDASPRRRNDTSRNPRNPSSIHRGSTASQGIFDDPLMQLSRHRQRGDLRHSRLSIVKTQIDTNEKEYLMKLRKQSQQLENDDVSKKVREFIGRKPVSMFRDRYRTKLSAVDGDSDDNDILSSEEEEKNRLQFLASANVTSRHETPSL